MKDSILTKDRFVKEYGRYFGMTRIEDIQNLGYLIIEKHGEGPYIFDTEGRRYLDLWCVGGVNNLGHRNPTLLRATEDALRNEDFGSCLFFSEAKAQLAKTLAHTTPGRLEVAMPLVTGAEAIDNAIKLVRGATGRTEILYADHAYHGTTGFALSMMALGSPMRDYAEPLIPDFREIQYGDISSLEEAISEKTAGVVLEPLRSDYDGRAPEPEYFPKVRQLCDRYGTKLIIDEVITGMGRLGTLWGCELWNIEPDLLVTGKGFSAGMFPISAVVMRPEILDFWQYEPFLNLSSYAWSNVGAIVARKGIEETLKILPQANAMGERLGKAVDDLAARYPKIISSVRRTGLLWAIDFANEALGAGFIIGMFSRGVLIVASSQNLATPKLYPPFILEDEHIEEFTEKAEETLLQIEETAKMAE